MQRVKKIVAYAGYAFLIACAIPLVLFPVFVIIGIVAMVAEF